jgi:hypothetical protein
LHESRGMCRHVGLGRDGRGVSHHIHERRRQDSR